MQSNWPATAIADIYGWLGAAMVDVHMRKWLGLSSAGLVSLGFFVALTTVAVGLPFIRADLGSGRSVAVLNTLASIGTSCVASFLFYHLVSERLSRRQRLLLRESAHDSFVEAKRNIALAVIHASQQGGRRDLRADGDTIDKLMSLEGFKALFKGGRLGDEGFYAFQNQMDDHTPEYGEIVFNLKVLARAATRLVDGGAVLDPNTYKMFVRLNTLVERIERNGPGYDESKALCGFIYEMFSGWSAIEGYRSRDIIAEAFEPE